MSVATTKVLFVCDRLRFDAVEPKPREFGFCGCVQLLVVTYSGWRHRRHSAALTTYQELSVVNEFNFSSPISYYMRQAE